MAVLFILLLPVLAQASLNQIIEKTAACIYPEKNDSFFFASYLELLKEHGQGNDPFDGGNGVFVRKFSLAERPVIFLINEDATYVDLLILNWDRSSFEGQEPYLDCQFGMDLKMTTLKKVPKKSLATQGANDDILSNFSYINGNYYFINYNFDVHSTSFLPPTHPIRVALNADSIPMFHPSEQKMKDLVGNDEYYSVMFPDYKTFFDSTFSLILHEAYHTFDGNDKISIKSDIDKKKTSIVIEALSANHQLNKLLIAYVSLVKSASQNQDDLLQKVKAIAIALEAMEKIEPYLVEMIRSYEYTEGFAEYVASYSMVQMKHRTWEENWIHQWQKDTSNAFFYKTGAFGGLVLKQHLHFKNWEKISISSETIWQFIANEYAVEISRESGQQLLEEVLSQPYEPEFKTYVIDTFTQYFTEQPWYQDEN
jgi:hypothetical protein